MGISRRIFFFICALPLSLIRADPAPDDKFTPVVPMYDYKRVDAQIITPDGPRQQTVSMGVQRQVNLIEPAKAKFVRDGMTLKELVDALGPGYNEYNDGTYQWFFTDTRTLNITLTKHEETEVLFFKETDKTTDDKMEWSGPPRENKGFTRVIVMDDYFYRKIKPLDAGKASLIKEGITRKELVDALGPGYMRPHEGVGVIQWYFSDGRALSVLLSDEKETSVRSFKTGSAHKLWWSPKP